MDSINNLFKRPPAIFLKQIRIHFQKKGKLHFCKMLNLLDGKFGSLPGTDSLANQILCKTLNFFVFLESSVLPYPLLPLTAEFYLPMTNLLTIYNV